MGLFCLLSELTFKSSRVSSCPPGWLLLKAPRSWITGPEQTCRDRAHQCSVQNSPYPGFGCLLSLASTSQRPSLRQGQYYTSKVHKDLAHSRAC